MLEYQNIKTFLQKVMLQMNVKFFNHIRLIILYHGHI